MHGYFQYEMGLTLALIALSMLSMSSESLAFGVLVDISGTHPKHVTSNANLPTSQLLMPPPPKKNKKTQQKTESLSSQRWQGQRGDPDIQSEQLQQTLKPNQRQIQLFCGTSPACNNVALKRAVH